MATKIEFLNLCARTIHATYSGDPIGLTPFVNAIELLESIDETNQHTDTLKIFIMTKLQGVALESVPQNPATIAIIKDSLRANIKADNSKVIAGKMLALRADRTNFGEYAKKVEQLGESLKRSLILEGIPSEKANEFTIDKTIELCRSNTSSALVKSVLASTKFDNYKAVVAKFIIESRTDTTERQVLSMRQGTRGNFNQNNRGNYRHGQYNNRNNNQNGRNNNNQHNNNQNNRNNNYCGRFNNNYRGRGGHNNRNNHRNNNNNVYYAEQNNSQQYPPRQHSVQVVQAEQQN